jgi:hypothetical protein
MFMQDLIDSASHAEAAKRYELDTVGIYRYKFGKRVQDTAKYLDSKGLSDDTLNVLITDPQSSEHLKMIGERLRILTERLADSDNRITKTLDKA